jgi:hypothetical protein
MTVIGSTGTGALVALFGGEDAPFGALVDDVVFEHQPAVVADQFAAGLVAGEASTATFTAFHVSSTCLSSITLTHLDSATESTT